MNRQSWIRPALAGLAVLAVGTADARSQPAQPTNPPRTVPAVDGNGNPTVPYRPRLNEDRDGRAPSANPPRVGVPPLVISNGNQIVPYRPPFVEGYGSPPVPPPFGYPIDTGVEVITVQPTSIVPRVPVPSVPVLAPISEVPADDGKARLTLWVPADAEVWIQGQKMDVSGSERHFTSPVLGQGQGYTYEIRTAWTENGKPVEFTRKVAVKSGDEKSVAFNPAPGTRIGRPVVATR
jgi:uncharacterized protein (TIGR03000 family)